MEIISKIIISNLLLHISVNLCSQLEGVKRLSPLIAMDMASPSASNTNYFWTTLKFLILSFLIPGKQNKILPQELFIRSLSFS